MSGSEPARIAARRIRSAILIALSPSLRRLCHLHTAPGETDGAVTEGVRVFDDDIPAIAKLDPPLLRALREAAMDAARDWVESFLDSGWRSPKYQERLLRQAVKKDGSDKKATVDTSFHVSGRGRHLAIPRHGVAGQT